MGTLNPNLSVLITVLWTDKSFPWDCSLMHCSLALIPAIKSQKEKQNKTQQEGPASTFSS